jgi:hypothetical protein
MRRTHLAVRLRTLPLLAGVGRAVQWGKPLKALGSSLWRVLNPRLRRLSRRVGLQKPNLRALSQ